MSADEFYRSEHGRALREERNRRADQAILDRQFREGEAAVDFFLAANRDYACTDENRFAEAMQQLNHKREISMR